MIEWQDTAIILSRRHHGERDVIISALTAAHGRHAAIVKGGASRKKTGIIMPGNVVSMTWKARLEEHLGMAVLEPLDAHAAAIMDDFGRLSAMNAALAILDSALPERLMLPGIYDHAGAFLTVLASEMATEWDWQKAYVQWELGLLADLGFGLDLSVCAATGRKDDLVYVSPKSGRAVSREAGKAWHDRLLKLPGFLRDPAAPETVPVTAEEMGHGLDLVAFFLERQVYAERRQTLPDARLRFRQRFAG